MHEHPPTPHFRRYSGYHCGVCNNPTRNSQTGRSSAHSRVAAKLKCAPFNYPKAEERKSRQQGKHTCRGTELCGQFNRCLFHFSQRLQKNAKASLAMEKLENYAGRGPCWKPQLCFSTCFSFRKKFSVELRLLKGQKSLSLGGHTRTLVSSRNRTGSCTSVITKSTAVVMNSTLSRERMRETHKIKFPLAVCSVSSLNKKAYLMPRAEGDYISILNSI